VLTARGYIPIPPHMPGAFDHADVYHATGRVYVANSSAGTVEVLDGPAATHLATIDGCPDASGVLCAQKDDLVFAAARATGSLLVLNANDATLRRTISVGSSPNGLAWDSLRKRVLVADVTDLHARLVDPFTGTILAEMSLPGRRVVRVRLIQRPVSGEHSRACHRAVSRHRNPRNVWRNHRPQ